MAIVFIALLTGVFTSIGAYATGVHTWGVGLSGVVMGMMGLFSCLLPRARIRCFYWFIVLFGWVAIPGWMLTLWFVGGDVVRLFTQESHGAINVMAHVTGGIGGYLFGVLFMRKAYERAKDLMFDIDINSS
jgi:membrane associated rhomboid family serine protease